MKKLLKVLVAFMCCGLLVFPLTLKGQTWDEMMSTVSIVNDWEVDDAVDYEGFSTRINIQGNDTVTESFVNTWISVRLKDILENEDKVFEITSGLPDDMSEESGESDSDEVSSKFLHFYRKLISKPHLFLTDSEGALKDIYDFNEIKSDVDSCYGILREWIKGEDIPEENQMIYYRWLDTMREKALDKQTYLDNAGMFSFYGKEFKLGESMEDVRLPLLLCDNQEVDARVTLTCKELEDEEDYDVVLLTTLVEYDREQLMNLLSDTLVTDEQKALMVLLRSSGGMAFTQKVSCVLDTSAGCILAWETEKKLVMPASTTIDYSYLEAVNPFHRVTTIKIID